MPNYPYPRPWAEHGRLRVSDDGHSLWYHDGKPFFWLGCTPWMLVALPPEDVTLFLADRARKGFNVVQMVTTNWLRGDYLTRQPFFGEDGRPYKQVVLNEPYWDYVDWVVERCALFGMHVALVTSWGRAFHNPELLYFSEPEHNNYELGVQLGRRYAACDHVLWIAAGEYSWTLAEVQSGADDPLDTKRRNHLLRRVAEGLRSGSQGKQLIAFHPHSGLSSSRDWHDDSLIDFNMVQSFGHENAYTTLVRQDHALRPAKPVLNAEPAYEDRWRYMPDRGQIDDWWMRMEGYVSVFMGGCGYTYGHSTIYHFGAKPEEGTEWLKWLDAPGSRQMQHLRTLMESVDWASRVCDDTLVVTSEASGCSEQDYIVSTRAVDFSWVMVYTSKGRGFRLNLAPLGKGAQAQWYDPRTGKTGQSFPVSDDCAEFAPPGEPVRGNDWVLIAHLPPRK